MSDDDPIMACKIPLKSGLGSYETPLINHVKYEKNHKVRSGDKEMSCS